jgi:hypothetical protein
LRSTSHMRCDDQAAHRLHAMHAAMTNGSRRGPTCHG